MSVYAINFVTFCIFSLFISFLFSYLPSHNVRFTSPGIYYSNARYSDAVHFVYLGLRARQHLRSLAPVIKWRWMIMMAKWYSGTCGPKASWHSSYRWGKTPKKPHPGNLSPPGIEPVPVAWQARMLRLAPQRCTRRCRESRTMDQNIRQGHKRIPESMVSRMLGPQRETTQDRIQTKDTYNLRI